MNHVPTQMPSQPTMAVGPVSMFVVVTSGPSTGQRFPVGGGLEVGREATGIRLSGDSQASRRHARLQSTPTGIEVSDLGSTNGTFVNGQRIQTAVAGPGDVIQVGSTSLRIET